MRLEPSASLVSEDIRCGKCGEDSDLIIYMAETLEPPVLLALCRTCDAKES